MDLWNRIWKNKFLIIIITAVLVIVGTVFLYFSNKSGTVVKTDFNYRFLNASGEEYLDGTRFDYRTIFSEENLTTVKNTSNKFSTLNTVKLSKDDCKYQYQTRSLYWCETRSNSLVQITNCLDIIFPEFKAHFSNRLGLTALYILKKYQTPERISKLTKTQFETISNKSMGKFTYPKFLKLKELAKNTIGIKNSSVVTVMLVHIDLFHCINTNIEILENEIKSIMSLVDCKITTIPGISLMSAATILGEVNDFKKFSNPAKLIAFAGFDIAIYQSGESLSYGKLVKRGSSLLRKTVWNLVLGSIRLIPEITDYYHNKRTEGKHRNVVFSAISRKILRIIYHIETNNVSYDKNKIR